MKQFFENIGIDILCTVILAGLTFFEKNYFKWEFQIPVWLCLNIAIVIIIVEKIIRYNIKKYRIMKAISTYNYGYFGKTYLYKWQYLRKSNGIYGHEAYNIKIKESQSKPNFLLCGHNIKNDVLKRFIQVQIVWMMNKKIQPYLLPALQYLNFTQDSQKHEILY